MNRKPEAVSSEPRARGPYVPRTTLVRARRPSLPPTSSVSPVAHEPEQAWQLIHDDPFDRAATDEQVLAIVASIEARSLAPYREALRRLVGIDDIDEPDARALFQRVLDHRRELSALLHRSVHLRVAALDVLTMPPARGARVRHDSHPIIVTPQMLERAFEEAAADGVTGLPQRAQFMSLLRHELRQRKRRSVSVVYVDLDRFKAVNDLFGHARGDDVLRAVAEAARGSFRAGDVLARLGGDEFGVLLVDVTPSEAQAAVLRFRARFEELTAGLGTSFSAGIATAAPAEDPEDLVQRADRAMYREKRARSAHDSG